MASLGLVPEPSLRTNAGWMLGGQGLRLLVQAGYFVVIARGLGPDGYGGFSAVIALVALIAPFVSLGSGNLLVKHVSRDPSVFPVYWARAVFITALTGTCLTLIVTAVGSMLVPVQLTVVLFVAVADLLCMRLVDVSGQAFQAHQILKRTAQFQVMPSIMKLGGALVCVALWSDVSPIRWSAVYLIASFISSLWALRRVARDLGAVPRNIGGPAWEIREGLHFSLSLASQTVYNDVDKVMLARLSTLSQAGAYAAGYRLIDVAITPIRSLLFATYAKFFQHGARSVEDARRFALRLMPLVVGYALGAAILLFVLAPVVRPILGEGYEDAVSVLRFLSVLPLLKGISYFGADILTGANRQGVRSWIQISMALLNIALNVWLIPAHGWRGAAVASLLTDVSLGVTMWVAVHRVVRTSRAVLQAEGETIQC